MSPLYQLSEEELITLLKIKDQRAFNYLYNNYSKALYGIVYKIVPFTHYAEEIIQDVFVKIWNYLSLFDSEKGRLYTWMIQIARNTAIDYCRSKNVRKQALLDTLKNSETENYTQSEQVKKSDYIGFKNILDALKPECRILIELAYFEGYTQKEISEHLNIPLGTVKTRTRSALLNLQQLLKEYQ